LAPPCAAARQALAIKARPDTPVAPDALPTAKHPPLPTHKVCDVPNLLIEGSSLRHSPGCGAMPQQVKMMADESPFRALSPCEHRGRGRIVMQPGFEGDQLPEAVHQIYAFFEADGLDEKIEYLRRHSFLLSDHSLDLFDHFQESADKENDQDKSESISSHRLIIKTVRELGFTEGAERLRGLVLMQTVRDFMDGYSWWDSYVFLQKHPELLSEDAQGFLVAIGERAHNQGDQEAEKVAFVHFNLLRRVMEVGAEQAFTEVGGRDFTAALQRRTR
jgi:hypothetical protein